jgi:hypothetical protein
MHYVFFARVGEIFGVIGRESEKLIAKRMCHAEEACVKGAAKSNAANEDIRRCLPDADWRPALPFT